MLPHKTLRRSTRLCLTLFAGSALLLLAGCNNQNNEVAQSGRVSSIGVANIGGPFSLTAHTGERFTEANLVGKPSLIYFGFSYCPDVCPTALQRLGSLQTMIDPEAEKLNYVFVGVDVERDTPESLAPYVTSRGFPKNLIGLAGTQEEMDIAISAYRVYAQKVYDPQSAAEYTFDHSDLVIMTDKDGQFKDIFTRNDSLAEIETRIKFLLASGK